MTALFHLFDSRYPLGEMRMQGPLGVSEPYILIAPKGFVQSSWRNRALFHMKFMYCLPYDDSQFTDCFVF